MNKDNEAFVIKTKIKNIYLFIYLFTKVTDRNSNNIYDLRFRKKNIKKKTKQLFI